MAPENGTALPSDGSSRKRENVDAVVQALGLTGILVPAVGLGVRWVAFGLGSPVPFAMTLASGSPIADLAQTGGLALLYPTAVAVPAFFFLSRFVSIRGVRISAQSRIEASGERLRAVKNNNDEEVLRLAAEKKRLQEALVDEDHGGSGAQTVELGEQIKELGSRMQAREAMSDEAKQLSDEADRFSAEAQRYEAGLPGWFKWLESNRWLGGFGAGATGILALLFLPGWPASVLPVAGLAVPFGLFVLLDRTARHSQQRLTLPLLVPSLIALLLIGVFYSGLAGTGLGLTGGAYRFEGAGQQVALPNGVYVELAQDSGLVYLHPCSSPSGAVVAITDASIEVVTSEKTGDFGAGPSLWSVLFGRAQASTGLRYACR